MSCRPPRRVIKTGGAPERYYPQIRRISGGRFATGSPLSQLGETSPQCGRSKSVRRKQKQKQKQKLWQAEAAAAAETEAEAGAKAKSAR